MLIRYKKAISRRISNLVPKALWQVNYGQAKKSKKNLLSFKNIHFGERCIIIGNGPSLNRTSLHKLKNEFTFGMNRIYLNFPKMNFEPTYYTANADLVISQFHNEISKLRMPKFVPWRHRKYFSNDEGITYLNYKYGARFSTNLVNYAGGGGTITFTALQLAYHMGFSKVYLIGVDHDFAEKGFPGEVVMSSGRDKNHFSDNYFGENVYWQLPNYKQMEIGYSMADKKFKENGRQVFDATIDGKLQIFEKVKFDDVFSL